MLVPWCLHEVSPTSNVLPIVRSTSTSLSCQQAEGSQHGHQHDVFASESREEEEDAVGQVLAG